MAHRSNNQARRNLDAALTFARACGVPRAILRQARATLAHPRPGTNPSPDDFWIIIRGMATGRRLGLAPR